MSRLITLLLGASLLVGVPTVAGCSSQQYEPSHWHAAFVAGIQNKVGRGFQVLRKERAGWAMDEYLVDQRDLPNGHVAYKYRYQGTCRYVFEVDPKTDIIVGAGWEGEAKHCAIVP